MRVLLISPTDTKGGASKVAFALAKGLNDRDVEAELHVASRFSDEPFVKALPAGSPPHRLAQKAVHRLGLNELNLASPFPKNLGTAFFDSFDLIHLHDLPGHFNLAHLPWLSGLKPLVWTIHMMRPFTGNCLFAYDCDRWKTTCGECPQFGQWPLDWLHRDGSALSLRLKRWIYRRSRLKTVGVSDWTTEQLRESVLKDSAPETILNPSDSQAYFPEDRRAARERLGIPADRFVIMFSTGGSLADRRKGLDLVEQALEKLSGETLFLLPTGISGVPESLRQLKGFPGLEPAHLERDADLRCYYNAADVVWHPTRADTSSMVSLEAMACGTPVIAAAVGGVPEIVRHEENGLLMVANNADALVAQTQRLMASPELQASLREGALAFIRSRAMSGYIDQHIRLYRRLLERI